jgi:hypothetical protein
VPTVVVFAATAAVSPVSGTNGFQPRHQFEPPSPRVSEFSTASDDGAAIYAPNAALALSGTAVASTVRQEFAANGATFSGIAN